MLNFSELSNWYYKKLKSVRMFINHFMFVGHKHLSTKISSEILPETIVFTLHSSLIVILHLLILHTHYTNPFSQTLFYVVYKHY